MAVDIRRDQASLSVPLRNRFKQALFAMKRMPPERNRLAPTAADPDVRSPQPRSGTPNTPQNVYDEYVHWHDEMMQPQPGVTLIHGTPLFLPWHRWFIRLFEMDLKRADWLRFNDPDPARRPPAPASGEPGPGEITLPYWDFGQHQDRRFVPGHAQVPWTSDFIGEFPSSPGPVDPDPDDRTQYGYVPNDFGDSTVWPIYFPRAEDVGFPPGAEFDRLTRRLVTDSATPLNDLPYVQRVVGERSLWPYPVSMLNDYDVAPWDTSVDALLSFRNTLEGWVALSGAPTGVQMHNRAHVFVGGHMAPVNLSANDPAFYLVHANVDRYWSCWQFYSVRFDRRTVMYPPRAVFDHAGAHVAAEMRPWEPGRPYHPEFAKVVGRTLRTSGIGPAASRRGWARVPTRTGYRYDTEATRPVLHRGR